jgi:hypothetical protein
VESYQFDAIARSMGMARSRRGLLRAFAGGVVAVLLGTELARPQTSALAASCIENCDQVAHACVKQCIPPERNVSGLAFLHSLFSPTGAVVAQRTEAACKDLCWREWNRCAPDCIGVS